jgi:hypothetical protein
METMSDWGYWQNELRFRGLGRKFDWNDSGLHLMADNGDTGVDFQVLLPELLNPHPHNMFYI